MERSTDRILTTHVGSLIRPTALLDYLKGVKEGAPPDKARYQQLLTDGINDVVARQVKVGVDIVNDGEFGKSSWANYILERITGFEVRPNQLQPLDWLGRDRERFNEFFAAEMPAAATGLPTDACIGPIRYRDPVVIEANLQLLKQAMSRAGASNGFMTVVAPASTAYNGVNEYYASEREYIYALADALRVEYQAVYRSGLTLQVDDAVLANMYDALVQKSPERYREWAELRVAALNHALEGIPESAVRYHVCFGSWHVPHVADAPLAEIVEFILKVHAGAYAIEAANPRHEHEWRVWENRRLPEGKILIPGVVTHHTTTVEHPQLVADRLIRFAKLVGRENLIAGTDCGFAQVETVKRVHPQVMWAKLEALVQGARLASRELWGR
jgi:5-methyltetrahydropteroyltriglutamate--homocysteine methyltransferase